MKRRSTNLAPGAGRTLVYLLAVLMALWVLFPIYLIGVAAFSPRQVIYEWPKAIVPRIWSLDTMLFFLNSHGVLTSTRNSVLVALITLVISLALGAPAGYALARFPFRGAIPSASSSYPPAPSPSSFCPFPWPSVSSSGGCTTRCSVWP